MVNFYNPYMTQGNYMQELQNMRDRIDSQIQQAHQQQQQSMQAMTQPTNLTQNFQLAPTNGTNNFKIVNNLEDVQKEIVLVDTYFVSKDNTQMWIKDSKGNIRVFTVNEIIPKDEKDILIENLQKQIKELIGGMSNASTNEYAKSNGDKLFEQQSNKSIGDEITEKQSSNVPIIQDSKTAKRKS